LILLQKGGSYIQIFYYVYIPEGPREMEPEVPPSLLPKTNMQQIEVAEATHLFAVDMYAQDHVSNSEFEKVIIIMTTIIVFFLISRFIVVILFKLSSSNASMYPSRDMHHRIKVL